MNESVNTHSRRHDHDRTDRPPSSTSVSERLERCLSEWAQLGVGFPVAPSGTTPDIERLLVETVRCGRAHARLLLMASTWLIRHGASVARHRLAVIARAELDVVERAVLGFLLSSADVGAGCRRFREALAACFPLDDIQPLFTAHARHPALLRRLQENATELSRRWGLLAEPIEAKFDALRPMSWVLRRNPELALRTDLGGDLRCSILLELAADPAAGESELALARRCGASRIAVRNALDRLESAGHVVRPHHGRCRQVRLVSAA